MEYVKYREINGMGKCYNVDYHRVDTLKQVGAEHDKRNAYHDNMAGNGYSELTVLTKKYKRSKILLTLAVKEINRRVKPVLARESKPLGGVAPCSEFQEKEKKRLKVNGGEDSIGYRTHQIANTFVSEDTTYDNYFSNKGGDALALPNDIMELSDTADFLKKRLNRMDEYEVLK